MAPKLQKEDQMKDPQDERFPMFASGPEDSDDGGDSGDDGGDSGDEGGDEAAEEQSEEHDDRGSDPTP
jgi:hypothetical protein